MPRLEAASISMTSSEVPEAISLQESQTPQGFRGWPVHGSSGLWPESAPPWFFPTPARSGKNVRMRDPVIANRVLQRFRDVRLPDKIRKRCGRHLRAMTW